MVSLRLYKTGTADEKRDEAKLATALRVAGASLATLKQERCYMVALEDGAPALSAGDASKLRWLVAETFEQDKTSCSPGLAAPAASDAHTMLLEVGPRLTFATAWSSNAVAICQSAGLRSVARVEMSRRYLISTAEPLTPALRAAVSAALHDRMTEQVYPEPLQSFSSEAPAAAATRTIPLMAEGRAALERLDKEMGLGFDEADLDYYTNLFVDKLGRDPTDVECFDMAQSNSEHSRHWFFGGKMVIDGVEQPQTLFKMVKETLKGDKVVDNSVIAFHDNSSAITGFGVSPLRPSSATGPSEYKQTAELSHLLLTAETHNFPTGVAPFPGAETGTGGRLRDTHATGRGSLVGAGVSAYCTGNLRIPGFEQPWEDDAPLAPNLATPLDIMVSASNGASDYGNKFGEPVLAGFARTFGMELDNGERREWLKPIMFSAGLGQIPDVQSKKGDPEVGMWVVKVGGPAYRIGLGGGAASSKAGGEDADLAALDFDAVQRGDAEMENKMNRVIRACVEMGESNPIVSIHDQGAGGNGNVCKEIVEPLGAKLQARSINSGDATLSILELWGAEYQENSCILLRPESRALFEAICARESCPSAFLGQVTGDGMVTLEDSLDGSTPYSLPLEMVLGKLPPKTFVSDRKPFPSKPLSLPDGLTVADALGRVLRLPSVGSKRFLTNKVDRSVTGLIAQQQCVGPLHIPLANCGVIAQTHTDFSGAATAVGEQPIKGLLDPAAMARLATAEAVTNLVWASVGGLGEVKCSANWMWAAKLEGEGAAMYDACAAMSSFMKAIGVAVDGGKDSLSMAARVGGRVVKAPGDLVVTVYAACDDVRKTVTPDLKADDSALLLVDIADGKRRLGGTALAQVYKQIGETPPDVERPELLAAAFAATQALLKAGTLRAGHDVSDGGLLTAALEMAFSGDRSLSLDVPAAGASPLSPLFAEEVGLLLEVAPADEAAVLAAYAAAGVPCARVGSARPRGTPVVVSVGGAELLRACVSELRDAWESGSFELEKLQCAPACVAQEQAGLAKRHAPQWSLSFTPAPTALPANDKRPRVAVLRQEGTNGDREMAAALHAAGCAPWDVSMSDLAGGAVALDAFRGVIFCGGFSYADVLDSAKGWAATIKFDERLSAQFEAFRNRPDAFSLGVCNGCQLMALLGWVPGGEPIPEAEQPRFVHNSSGRFESRWSAVKVAPSPAVLLRGMEGSSLGVWVAHGEGRAHFPRDASLQAVLKGSQAPLRYINDACEVTQEYPHNPNGSPEGIAALCSPDGRHLAMMPHPERCFVKWQCPWAPPEWEANASAPWLRLFQNAAAFCASTQ